MSAGTHVVSKAQAKAPVLASLAAGKSIDQSSSIVDRPSVGTVEKEAELSIQALGTERPGFKD